jgi:hypothetical protein
MPVPVRETFEVRTGKVSTGADCFDAGPVTKLVSGDDASNLTP